jgi:putative DNA primase/helicase
MNQFKNIPEELKKLHQWVCRKEKIPFNPVTGAPAKAGQPDTWASFEDCVNALDDGGYDGIGFEFNNNGIVGIDLDHVIADDGSLFAEAVEIVAMLNSYTEYSPSGKGLHIIIKGDIPVDGRKKGFIEMYKAKRYFTMTGNVYGELKPINEKSEQVMQIFNKYFTNSVSVKATIKADINKSYINTGKDYLSIGLAKDAVFKSLWDGEYQSEKCTSESEKDLALMGKLLYWCSGNADAAIENFKDSPYAMAKDNKHTTKLERSDYLQRTALRAMQSLKSTAELDDEKFIKKFSKGTAEIQETLNNLQPHINYTYDDKGNGELFADAFSSVARFNITANEWLVYDGRVWLKDVGGMLVSRMAKQLKDELLMFSISIDNETQKTAYQKHILKMGSRAVRETMVKDARDKYCISNGELDKDLDLLNLQNGTLNLKSLEFREHRATDLISKIANVNYDPTAKSKLWNRFIDEVMMGDTEKTEYLQKAIGYGITADTSLETCFILYGATTRNGKSTLVETIMHMLGGSSGYAMQMKPESLAQKQNNDSRQANGDIARLEGARFLNVSEPPKKMIFDAALLKTLLGRDSIVARHLHEREFEFIPMFKLFMNTNYLPLIQDDTLFSSGRINVISFKRHFGEQEQDKGLKNKLRSSENLSGILNWCLDGLKKFHTDGLKPTTAIVEATADYRQESDKVGKFLAECLEPADENMMAGTAYEVYEQWCRACGYGCENQGNFFAELRAKNLISKSGTVNGKTRLRVIKGYKVVREWLHAIPLV